MKKLYCKPEVHYESFDLMDAIASCTLTATQGDPATCTYYDESFGVLFTPGINDLCANSPESFEVLMNAIFSS